MFVTSNMGLTAWDLGTDRYDHAQLAVNFDVIDKHDHTQGKGTQVPKAGIQDSAITRAKIASDAVIPTTHIPVDSIPQSRLGIGSVGASELQDGSVGPSALAPGAVTLSKLDAAVLPIGMVVMWYRSDPSVLPPSGWEIMDGRAWSSIPNKLGAGGVQWTTGNIPNMANKFPLGSALSGTGSTPDVPPGIGSSGGLQQRDLSHTHTANSHSHTVDNHSHGIGSDGDHYHMFVARTPEGFIWRHLCSRDVGVPRAEGTRQALFAPDHNRGGFIGSNLDLPMTNVGAHSHGGATGVSSAGTNSATVTLNNAMSGTQDLRPAYVGLLFIMRVG